MYVANPAFETWLSEKAGTDEEKIDQYISILCDYGYLGSDGSVKESYASAPDPAGVESDLTARLSRLDPGVLDLLGRASVEGQRFSKAVLAALGGAGIDQHLADAVKLGVIAAENNTAEIPVLGSRYRFVPLQLCERLYENLSESERAQYHTELVEYLSAELEHVEEAGARDMISDMISGHNKRYTRPDPPPR